MKKKRLINKLCIMLLISLLFTFISGCSNSNNENNDPSINKSSDDIPTNVEPQKRVAITFDDGPHNVRTKLIVDELTKYGFHATFFVIGNRIDGTEYNGLSGLKYAAEAGNEIGIHGYTHSSQNYYDKCDEETYRWELSKTSTAIKNAIGNYEIKLMRPVGGRITDERIASSPYSIIMWDVDSDDWKHKYTSGDSDEICAQKVNEIVENVMLSVHDGSIILMHDIYESTYDAVVIILERLNAEGYEVVTVSELIGDNLKPGYKYTSGN